ncbi:type IV toxin-antitoxin system AbiEi family antitoxin [Falsarthrobacter nasiphocae]|uniref:Uncharacterized protein n=1 Tax=Falsarthrobacter nasiphocae TaxID=189863 RepID=A0AAE4C7Z8_9MICC|nr:type IV toxin-antitoxin system AbiEi family antitoxin [Falsarthrobacter nasiphocae]MDR6891895.1 hypothetical protein [Falsarthrobacter nasiphocae]
MHELMPMTAHHLLSAHEINLRSEIPLGALDAGALTRARLQSPRGSSDVELVYLPSGTVESIPENRGITTPFLDDGTPHPPPLVVLAPYISPRSAEAFRRMGVNYVDMSGNMNLKFGGTYIEIQGRPKGPWAEVQARLRVSEKGSLFTPRRSQVIFALLAWPQLRQAPQREVAEAAGVSLGLVNSTVGLLVREGFVVRDQDGVRLTRREDLEQIWLSSYPTGLGPALELRRLEGDIDRRVTPSAAVVLGGESAVPDLIRPTTLTVYTNGSWKELAVRNRWRAPSTGEGNIVIRRKFWTEPDGTSVDTGLRSEVAPALLVRADLMASRDPRQWEVAKQIALPYV